MTSFTLGWFDEELILQEDLPLTEQYRVWRETEVGEAEPLQADQRGEDTLIHQPRHLLSVSSNSISKVNVLLSCF